MKTMLELKKHFNFGNRHCAQLFCQLTLFVSLLLQRVFSYVTSSNTHNFLERRSLQERATNFTNIQVILLKYSFICTLVSVSPAKLLKYFTTDCESFPVIYYITPLRDFSNSSGKCRPFYSVF